MPHIDYVPQIWADGPSGGTPITAARLLHLEAGIDAVAAAVGGQAAIFVQEDDPDITNPEVTGPAVWYVLDTFGNVIGKRVRA